MDHWSGMNNRRLDLDLMGKVFEILLEHKQASRSASKENYGRMKAKEYFMRSRSPNKVPKLNGGYQEFTPTPRAKKVSVRREVEAKPLEP